MEKALSLLGKRIKEARAKAELTQEELAEKANIAVNYLSEIERGVKMPSLPSFVALAQALGVSADALLCDELETASKIHANNEISEKLDQLTPKQRATAVQILEAFISGL